MAKVTMIENRINSILLKFPDHIEKFESDYFIDNEQKSLFEKMKSLYLSGRPVNLNSLFESGYDVDLLNDIFDLELSDANIDLYLEKINFRNLKMRVLDISNSLESYSDIDLLTDDLEKIIWKIQHKELSIKPIKELYINYISDFV